MMVGLLHLLFHFLSRLAFHHHVSAEFTRNDDQRAVQQAALLKIEKQLRDGRVHILLHTHGARCGRSHECPSSGRECTP